MSVHYDAFISYRHAPLDSKIAGIIQRKLERAHIPKAIQQQTGKTKFERIFRDKEELPISIDINENLIDALRNSDFLIVICSTNTASSVWVQREIEEFLKTHSKDRVLTVLADGEPQDVIPEILQFRDVTTTNADGQSVVTQVPTEPLSCDFRNYPKKKQEEFLRLMAAMLGCTYDGLRQRQRRRQRRQLIASFAAILVLVSSIAIYALDRAARIQEEAENTQIAQSRYLSQISSDLLQSGNRETAIQVALAALPGEENPDRPLVTEAVYALNNAVYSYRQAHFNDFVVEGTTPISVSVNLSKTALTENRWMLIDYTDTLHVFDLQQGTEIATWTKDTLLALSGEDYLSIVATFIDDDCLILSFPNKVIGWDLNTNQQLWATTCDFSLSTRVIVGSEFNQCAYIVAYESNYISVIQVTRDGTLTYENYPYTTDVFGNANAAALSADGTSLAVYHNEYLGNDEYAYNISIIDLTTGNMHTFQPEYDFISAMEYHEDGKLYYIASDYDAYSGTKLCNYVVACYDPAASQQVWAHEDSKYVTRNFNDYSNLFTLMEFHTLITSDDEPSRPVLFATVSNRLILLDPDSGEQITYAEFASELLRVDYCSDDRVYLVLRNGALLQYIPDSDLTGEMASINAPVVTAAFNAATGTYAMVVSEPSSVIWMTNQLTDPRGTPLELEYSAFAIYYSDTERQIRTVGERQDTGTQALYRFNFYAPFETEPFAVSDWFAGSPEDCFVTDLDGDEVAYWIYEDDCFWLMGWNLTDNTLQCNVQLTNQELFSVTMMDICDQYIYWHSAKNVSRMHLISEEVETIDIENYLYTATISPDGTQISLDYEKYDTDERLLDIIATADFANPDAERQTLTVLPSHLPTLIEPVFSLDGSSLVIAAGQCYEIWDLTTQTVRLSIPVECYKNYTAAFLSDQILTVCGDDGLLSTWDLTTGEIIMEDSHVFSAKTIYINGTNLFTQNSASEIHLYRINEDGTFAREITLSYGLFAPDSTELCTRRGNNVTYYPVYTLEELIAKGWELVDNQPLSETDRIKYFIDG